MIGSIGSIVLSTSQGLGYLAKDFYDNGIINRVFVQRHSTRPSHWQWYPDRCMNVRELYDCDILLFFETPFDWNIIAEARRNGIATVLMPMHECTPYPFPVRPDVILAPSLLEMEVYKKEYPVFIPVPVSQKWKLRTRAKTYIHNAGNGGIRGRNGTKELLDAMQYVKSPIKLIVRTQTLGISSGDKRVEIRKGDFNKKILFEEGDVFIFTEKFNGLSLPLQEAFASGMAVIATDRFPMNTWLPKDLLVKPSGYHKERLAIEFDCADIDPRTIAEKIDSVYNTDISSYSRLGKEYGLNNSWRALLPKYKEFFYGNTEL